ncbi:MAG: UvrB/UvrC motif-containing protein [Phycisphaerae bacterium]|nr:UvrB/UvrC motif-containing protein [Phycisphaerae bacterium]
MRCQRCQKARATVHLTECTGEEPRERHLCDACAEEEGLTLKQQSGFTSLLEKFVDQSMKVEELARLTCPQCGLSFAEFRNSGLLGCPNDYSVFEKLLVPLLERTHDGHTEHVGKKPGDSGPDARARAAIAQLRRDLDRAVEDEDYELAARLRDQIRVLSNVED